MKSGCSIAAPILAGIAATVIQYVAYTSADDPNTQRLIRTRDGIQAVMREMGESANGEQRSVYVAPWKFFKRNTAQRIALVTNALAELQPSR